MRPRKYKLGYQKYHRWFEYRFLNSTVFIQSLELYLADPSLTHIKDCINPESIFHLSSPNIILSFRQFINYALFYLFLILRYIGLLTLQSWIIKVKVDVFLFNFLAYLFTFSSTKVSTYWEFYMKNICLQCLNVYLRNAKYTDKINNSVNPLHFF